jgi:hypothetical protein
VNVEPNPNFCSVIGTRHDMGGIEIPLREISIPLALMATSGWISPDSSRLQTVASKVPAPEMPS